MQTSAFEAATNEAHTQLTTVQGNALLDYGVRMIVIRELCQALLTHFPVSSRADIERSFRTRIERVLEMTDDNVFPAGAQTAFLNEINYFLGTLGKKAAT
ncbi:hypothetical protein AWB70_06057 [Caballeronia cordobensis]|uniref:Uncharacterized protein n=1 Tax=Caballeronia cordobensis TaxID=1353886 RepID=A0A158J7Z3_CABCO|nr:hypothetical protein [Caballeronia cordobensis]SAL64987.1 hypothetical protein AWB70_06057 [Caballeronia cordobensis]